MVRLRRGVGGAQGVGLLQAAQAGAVEAGHRVELVHRVRSALRRPAREIFGGGTGVGQVAGEPGLGPAAASVAGVETRPPGAVWGQAGEGRGLVGGVAVGVAVGGQREGAAVRLGQEVGGAPGVVFGVATATPVVMGTVGGGGAAVQGGSSLARGLAHGLVVLLRRVGVC